MIETPDIVRPPADLIEGLKEIGSATAAYRPQGLVVVLSMIVCRMNG